MATSAGDVGYCKPPRATRFQKGRSGNPRGRPRNKRREIPYDALLGQMVTIREDGRERRVTAAEAFLLHLTKQGLEGDSAAARASLAAIEDARSRTRRDEPIIEIVTHAIEPGSVGPGLDALGLAAKFNRYSDNAYYKLKSWIVEAALARLEAHSLTFSEQQTVIEATQTPHKVEWPSWWSD